jgi:hypothetical protein
MGETRAVVSLSGTNVPTRVVEIRADTVRVRATPGGHNIYANYEERLRIVATLAAPAGNQGGVIGVNVCANVMSSWESCECAYRAPYVVSPKSEAS